MHAPRSTRRGIGAIVGMAVAAIAVGCTTDADEPAVTARDAAPSGARFEQVASFAADEPAALAVGPDGALYVGERRTGRVLRVAADDLTERRPRPIEVARFDVATDGQQGLLGLAVTVDGWLLAGLTAPADAQGPARQEVVRRRLDDPAALPQVVWRGPGTADLAVGGRIVLAPDGRVVTALGDYGDGRQDPPFGSVLSLDPAGPPDQVPQVLSTGWNNPFALAYAPDGALWVADNAPGSTPERLGRGDAPGPRYDLEGSRAPSGLAATGDDTFLLCGYLSKELTRLRVPVDGAAGDGVVAQPGSAGDCRLDVVVLGTVPGARDLVASAEQDGVSILRP